MTHNHYIYIAVMALVSYAIRILPLTLIRKPIKNRFIQCERKDADEDSGSGRYTDTLR